jgi:hypothetical protein
MHAFVISCGVANGPEIIAEWSTLAVSVLRPKYEIKTIIRIIAKTEELNFVIITLLV